SRLRNEGLEILLAYVLNRRACVLDSIHDRLQVHPIDALDAFLPHILQLVHLVADGIDMIAGAKHGKGREEEEALHGGKISAKPDVSSSLPLRIRVEYLYLLLASHSGKVLQHPS